MILLEYAAPFTLALIPYSDSQQTVSTKSLHALTRISFFYTEKSHQIMDSIFDILHCPLDDTFFMRNVTDGLFLRIYTIEDTVFAISVEIGCLP